MSVHYKDAQAKSIQQTIYGAGAKVLEKTVTEEDPEATLTFRDYYSKLGSDQRYMKISDDVSVPVPTG